MTLRQLYGFFLKSIAFSAIVFSMNACSPTRRLKDNQRLVTQINIKGNTSSIPVDEARTFIKLKTNRKVLFNRFYLQMYNLVNQEKEAEKNKKRIEERAKLNEKRRAEGKKEKPDEPGSFNQWLLSIGEPPALLDENLLLQSKKQLKYYYESKGFLNATVHDSIVYSGSKKARVNFYLNLNQPYLIQNINYQSADKSIHDMLQNLNSTSLLKQGMRLDKSVLTNERDRIVNALKDSGYFDINSSFISYQIDTGLVPFKTDVNLIVSPILKKASNGVDSVVSLNHIRYHINKLKFITDFSYQSATLPTDSLVSGQHIIYFNEKLKYKPVTLLNKSAFCPGDLYNQGLVEKTYQNLANLRQFRFVNISFLPSAADSAALDCVVQLTPLAKRAYKAETQGTNTQGNLGVAVDFSYQNRNWLKGFEMLEFKIFTSLEVQRILNENSDQLILPFLPFNTFMLGPELSVTLPKLWPLRSKLSCDKVRNVPVTKLNTSLNYQIRPDYQRSIFNITQSYRWNQTRKNITFNNVFDPFMVNFVSVVLSDNFSQLIEQLNSLFYRASFSDQLILGIRFSTTLSNQKKSNADNFYLLGFTAESSGFWAGVINRIRPFEASNSGQGTILGVPYSQYLKFDIDFRRYKPLNKNSDLAFRAFGGIGLPYDNSDFLPFVKSYSAGGANDIRAWIARNLGPGSYRFPDDIRFEQIGDIKLMVNLEYRYKLYRMVETALFVDAGNIWLRKKDNTRPGAEFEFNKVFLETAIGAGVGLRLNFNYFIFRLDAAQPIRYPYNLGTTHWALKNMQIRNTNINFGIGYPF